MTLQSATASETAPVLEGLDLLHVVATQRHARTFLARCQRFPGRFHFAKVASPDEDEQGFADTLRREFQWLSTSKPMASGSSDPPWIKPSTLRDTGEVTAILFPLVEGISLSETLRLARTAEQHGEKPGEWRPIALTIMATIVGALRDAANTGPEIALSLSTSGADHVLLTPSGELRLIGLADLIAGDGFVPPSNVWTRFTAPELAIEGHTVDLRSDIYAAGALLFELLTLRPITSDDVLTEHLAYRMYRNIYPVVSDVVPEYADLDPVVTKALRWMPGERYAGWHEFDHELALTGPERITRRELGAFFRLVLSWRKNSADTPRSRTVGARLSSIES